MSSLLDEKVHAFTSIMKNIGYQDNINKFTIRSLVDIPDIRDFFAWFLDNVNENWVLTSEQKFWFREKESKGQVVYDVDKLTSTSQVINEDKFLSLTEIERENALLEEELSMFTAQLEFKQKQRTMLNDEMSSLKKRLYELESKDSKLETTVKYRQNKLKLINQTMNKCLMEFQAKLGNEDKFNQKICADLNEIEASMEKYVQNEKQFLGTIKDYTFLEFDYNNLELLTDKAKSGEKMEALEKEMKIMHMEYPEIMNAWLSSNFGLKVAQSSLAEMNKILDHIKQFFEFSQEQLEISEKCRGSIQTRIAQNQTSVSSLKEEMIEMSNQIEQYIQTLSDQKLEKLLQYDMDQRQIELGLFLNKQEKLSRLIASQNSRVNLLDYLGRVKINQLERLKKVFEELIESKSVLTSRNNPNQSLVTHGNLGGSFYIGNATQMNNTTQVNNGMNSFYNSSFSHSMANLLSSTAYPGTNSPPNMTRDMFSDNTPPHSMFKNTQKIPHSVSLTGMHSAHFGNSADGSPNSAGATHEHWHILNKLLISTLSHLRCDETAQKLIQFDNNQISVNFADNLENFTAICESVSNKFKTMVTSNIRQSYTDLHALIETCIEYCYEKDEDPAVNPYTTLKYNFSDIKLATAKFLVDPLNQFNRLQEELESHVIKLLKVINTERSLLASSSLEVLKRNLFVYFVNKPQLIEGIVLSLNQIN